MKREIYVAAIGTLLLYLGWVGSTLFVMNGELSGMAVKVDSNHKMLQSMNEKLLSERNKISHGQPSEHTVSSFKTAEQKEKEEAGSPQTKIIKSVMVDGGV